MLKMFAFSWMAYLICGLSDVQQSVAAMEYKTIAYMDGCDGLSHKDDMIPADLLQQVNDPVILENLQFKLLATDRGTSKYKVKADKMYQYESGNVELIGGIEIVMWEPLPNQQAEKEAIYIQANKLTYVKAVELYLIEGDVLIRRPHDGLKVVTQKLSYNVKEDMVFTESPIKIEQKDNLLEGIGLYATKDFRQYSIGHPNGILDITEIEQ